MTCRCSRESTLDGKRLSFAVRLLFKIVFPIRGVRDYTCGYRAYRGTVLREAFDRYGDDFINEEGFRCKGDILISSPRDITFTIRAGECETIPSPSS